LRYPFDIAILNGAQSIRRDESLLFQSKRTLIVRHKINSSLLGKKEKSKYFHILTNNDIYVILLSYI